MIDKYIILNRTPSIIVRLFILTIVLLLILFFCTSKKIKYDSFYTNQAYFIYCDNDYYLKTKIYYKDSNLIIENNEIMIDNQVYKYKLYKFEEADNEQIIFLNVLNLSDSYKKENYIIDYKIKLVNK